MNTEQKYWLRVWGGAAITALVLIAMLLIYNYKAGQKEIELAKAGMEQRFFPANTHNNAQIIWVKAHKRCQKP